MKAKLKYTAMSVLVFMALSLVCRPDTAISNDGFMGESAKGVFPLFTEEIRMVSEHIVIRIHDARSADVQCNFVFKNDSDKDINALVGFPGVERTEDVMRGYNGLGQFNAWVEGKRVKVTERDEDTGPYFSLEDNKVRSGAQRTWYVWNVTFPANKTIKISNSYQAGFSGGYFESRLVYVLETGAFWKGRIEKAVIEAVFSSADDIRDLVKFTSPGHIHEGRKLKWEFSEFEPKDNDIYIVMVPKRRSTLIDEYTSKLHDYMRGKSYDGDARLYSEQDLTPQYLNSGTGWGWDGIKSMAGSKFDESFDITPQLKKQFLRALRNEIFARHGRTFKSDDLRALYKSTKWYVPASNYSDAILNETERKNVQFLLKAEKEASIE